MWYFSSFFQHFMWLSSKNLELKICILGSILNHHSTAGHIGSHRGSLFSLQSQADLVHFQSYCFSSPATPNLILFCFQRPSLLKDRAPFHNLFPIFQWTGKIKKDDIAITENIKWRPWCFHGLMYGKTCLL